MDNLTSVEESESVCSWIGNTMGQSMEIESCDVPTEGNEKQNRLSLLPYVSDSIAHFVRKKFLDDSFCHS